MDDLIEAHPDRLKVIRYHMSWPGPFDPFYLANTEENDARRSYYGLNFVPNLWYDGVANPGAQVAMYESWLLTRLANESSMIVDTAIDNAYLSVDLEAVDAVAGDLKLMAVIVENQAQDGAKLYDQVMRRFIGGTSGLGFTISEGESQSYLFDFDVDPSWNPDNLEIVVFVQSVATKEVIQADATAIGFAMPKLALLGAEVDDGAGGDGDGRLEAGESADLIVTLENMTPWADASDIEIVLDSDDPDLTITDASATIPAIVSGGSESSTVDPIGVELASGASPHNALLDFTITANGGTFQRTAQLSMLMGHPELLLVDDDGGGDTQAAYTATLDSLEKVYEHWDLSVAGLPAGDFYQSAKNVIWFTGEVEEGGFTADELTFLQQIFDSKRGLYLSGLANAEGLSQTQLLAELFGAEALAAGGGPVIEGEPGDAIGDSLLILLDHDPVIAEVVVPTGSGVAMMHYLPGGEGAGVHNQSGGKRSVFTAFDFSVVGAEHRPLLMSRILDWFEQTTGVAEGEDAPPAPLAGVTLRNTPNPFNPTTKIAFTLPRAAPVELSIYDLRGQRVITLLDEERPAGAHAVAWTGENSRGVGVASGVYVLRMEAEGFGSTDRRMVLLK